MTEKIIETDGGTVIANDMNIHPESDVNLIADGEESYTNTKNMKVGKGAVVIVSSGVDTINIDKLKKQAYESIRKTQERQNK